MSDNKITQDQLEPNVMEELESGIGDLSVLSTENKDSLVAAVTEIYGKSIIADAVGEPLAVTETFSEMGNEINNLLNSFKTNMMNSGVIVESGDKFKQLIEKIKGLGGEDATLRDSLASILETKGVEVTEEDDMASLIGKVDSEFDEMENLKQDLIDILTNRGISVEEGLTTEELVNKIDEGTKFELKAGTTGTYLVTFVSSTVGTYSDGVERTINGTINFDKNKFRITGVSISYTTECEVTTKCNTSLVQYRNDNAIKTHFTVDGKNTNDFGSWSGTVTDVQHGDIFKFVTRHQQVSTTSNAWIRHTLKITCVINI